MYANQHVDFQCSPVENCRITSVRMEHDPMIHFPQTPNTSSSDAHTERENVFSHHDFNRLQPFNQLQHIVFIFKRILKHPEPIFLIRHRPV